MYPNLQYARHIKLLIMFLLLTLGFLPQGALSDASSKEQQGLARFSIQRSTETLTVSPLYLQGGSTLTVISPEKWDSLSDKLLKVLSSAHKEYSKLFGEIPAFASSVQLIDQESFLKKTGAPRWTNALYYKGEIMIPITDRTNLDMKDLIRSVRHEYTHAVISTLSGGRCPGWLDEGLAEWTEGSTNPALLNALTQWLKKNSPVPLSMLQGGFTRLDPERVPAAYAQSLVAAEVIIKEYGFKTIRSYLNDLKAGTNKSDAFTNNFGFSEEQFEEELNGALAEFSLKR